MKNPHTWWDKLINYQLPRDDEAAQIHGLFQNSTESSASPNPYDIPSYSLVYRDPSNGYNPIYRKQIARGLVTAENIKEPCLKPYMVPKKGCENIHVQKKGSSI